MALPNYQSPTHAAPRITKAKFASLLKSKGSPALAEVDRIWEILVTRKVDPSFALAQFRVESQYGTSGYAKVTGSWGNMLTDAYLTVHQSGTYAPGNGYTYAKYTNYADAVTDYCTYLDWYRDRYGFSDIYRATARWTGKVPGSSGHISYVNTIISDMIDYEVPETTFVEVGDKMFSAEYVDRTTGKFLKRYPVKNGDVLYRGTNGDVLKVFSGTGGDALFLGPVGQVWKSDGTADWGVILIGGTSFPKGQGVYIKNVKKSLVVPA